MKVMFISHSAQIAGAERALINVMRFIDRSKINPICVFPQQDGPAKKKIESLNIPIVELEYGFYIPGYSNDFSHMYSSFYNLFFTVQPHVIVVNTQVLFPAILAAKSLNIKVILHSHGLISKELFPLLDELKWSAIDALHLLLSDKVFVPAYFIKSIYAERYPSLVDKIKVVSNGTDVPQLDKNENVDGDNDLPVFSMLCTIEENKGVEYFIQAAKIYLEQDGKALFHVYGHGDTQYVEALSKLIHSLGISHSFFINEKKMDVESIYSGSTCIIVASKIESFSLVSIEAMSYGCPVIATRCGGPEEIIYDEVDGYLVNIGDSRGIADRMYSIATIPYLRDRFSLAGRKKVLAKFNIEEISKLYYEEILATKDTPTSVGGAGSNDIITSVAFNLLSERELTNISPHKGGGGECDLLNTNISSCLYNPQKDMLFSFSSKIRMNNIPYISGFYKMECDTCVDFIEFYIGGDFGVNGLKDGLFGIELVLDNSIKLNAAYHVSDVLFSDGIVRIPVKSMIIPALSHVEVRLFIRHISRPIYIIGKKKLLNLRFYPLINMGKLNDVL